jgi:hypothetical protein
MASHFFATSHRRLDAAIFDQRINHAADQSDARTGPAVKIVSF